MPDKVIQAQYDSLCPCCRQRINKGEDLAPHSVTRTWVHSKCVDQPTPDGWQERYDRMRKLTDRQVYTVTNSMKRKTTENGRYINTDRLCREVALMGCNRPREFEAGYALATQEQMRAVPEQAKPQVIDETTLRLMVKELVDEMTPELLGNSLLDQWRDKLNVVADGIKESLRQYRQIEVKDPIGTFVPEGGFKMPAEFDRIIQLCSQRVHVLLVGPSGCGKTFVAEHVMKAIRTKDHPDGLPFSGISCSVGMSESHLAGYLLPSGENARFEYFASLFVKAYTEGGGFIFDEIDSADGNTMTFCNAALANSHMFVAQRLQGQVVRRHPDFVCMAAANTYGLGADSMYVGRNQLDKATLNRFEFGTVRMGYDPHVEEAIIDPEVLGWGRAVRHAIFKHGLMQVMSTRDMISATKMKRAYGWGPAEWTYGKFASWSREELQKLVNEIGDPSSREANGKNKWEGWAP